MTEHTGQPGEVPAPLIATQRLSPRSLVVDPIRHLGRFLIPFAAAFLLSGHFTIDRAAYYGFAGGVVAVGYAVLRWTMFRYTLHASRLDITSGLLARRTRSIPLDRVRGVDLTATPLHRMMGIVVVRVDAAAGGHSRKDEGVLDAVTAADGARLRRLLLARRDAAAPASNTSQAEASAQRDADRGTVVARMRPAWFLYAPLTGAYLFAPLAVLGTVWGWVNQNGMLDRRQVEGAANFVVTDPWLVGIVGGLALLLAMPLASVAMSAVLNWNFTVRETAPALELERGLLTRRHVTLERRRLRGWELVEALLARPAHAARLRALVTGLGTDAHGSRAELLPVAPVAAARRLATDAVGAQPGELRRHPRRARRRRLVRAVLPWFVLAVLAFLANLPAAGVPLLVLAALGIPLGLDRYRSLGHGYDGARVSVRIGSWSRRTVVLERRAVVGWQVRQTLFQRRQGLATLVVGVGAGHGGYHAVDMDARAAGEFAAEVTPRWVKPFLGE